MTEMDLDAVAADQATRLAELERRQGRLERQARRWRAGVLGLSAVLILGAAAATQSFDAIETRELSLKDADGNLKAILAVRPDGTPGFALFGPDNSVRLSLDLAGDGAPSVNLHDPSGVVRAALAVRENGTPGLGLFDLQGTLRASIDLGPDATSGINVFDPQGVIRAAMAVRSDGSPGFGLFSNQGEVKQSFELSESPSDITRLVTP